MFFQGDRMKLKFNYSINYLLNKSYHAQDYIFAFAPLNTLTATGKILVHGHNYTGLLICKASSRGPYMNKLWSNFQDDIYLYLIYMMFKIGRIKINKNKNITKMQKLNIS